MNLQQLRYFVTLAQAGHFGRAADILCITQPALSNSIKGLERELKSDLFVRSSTGVYLTSYGRRFHSHIVKALGDIDRAVSIPHSPSVDKPSITVATVAAMQQSFLPQLLVEYAKSTRSSTVLDIYDARTSSDCEELLREGKIDFALCARPAQLGSAVWTPVIGQQLVVGVAETHPLAQREMVSLRDIFDYPIVTYRSPSSLYYPVEKLLGRLDYPFREAFNDEIGALPYLAANPQCVALLLDTVEGRVRSFTRFIPIEELQRPFHLVGLLYNLSTVEDEAAAHFVSWVEKRYQNMRDFIAVESLIMEKNK